MNPYLAILLISFALALYAAVTGTFKGLGQKTDDEARIAIRMFPLVLLTILASRIFLWLYTHQ